MDQSESEFKKEFKASLHAYCWDNGVPGIAEKEIYDSIIKDCYNKLDKHQKRKIKMLCEVFKHKPPTTC